MIGNICNLFKILGKYMNEWKSLNLFKFYETYLSTSPIRKLLLIPNLNYPEPQEPWGHDSLSQGVCQGGVFPSPADKMIALFYLNH